MQLPEEQRRVEVTVQKSIKDVDGRFCGVLRVGLFAERLGHIVRFKSAGKQADDPHRVFLADSQGRLISRITPADRLEKVAFDLRIMSPDAPPEVVTALRCVDCRPHDDYGFSSTNRFEVDGVAYLATFLGMPRTESCGVCNNWIVCVVVPERYYLEALLQSRTQILVAQAVIILAILAGGIATLKIMLYGLARIQRQTDRMRRFEFSAESAESRLTEIRQVLTSIEGAKIALRAMGKYVPMDIVRKLYDGRSEPALGSESREISVMFTDIEQFTSSTLR